MDVKHDLNQCVKVKLTDVGVKVLRDRRDKLNEAIRSRGGIPLDDYEYKPDAEGYTKFQMWDLMSIFGHLVSIATFELPFETGIIIIGGRPIEEE